MWFNSLFLIFKPTCLIEMKNKYSINIKDLLIEFESRFIW